MKTSYGVLSDTHNHGWSAFSETDKNGINSRLQAILDETYRCAEEVKNAGGKRMYHTGDLFHVRGSVAPSVLNPTIDTYKKIIETLGVEIFILAGNHDLEFREANRNGSAVTALEGIGCKIVNETMTFGDEKVVMIPWFQNVDELKKEINQVIDDINGGMHSHLHNDWTLMIHAPVDGVISGIPSHGLNSAYLGSLGFKRVFSGHYHNHKDFGNGVYSVGALTHNSWSDLGSKAGFLIVSDSEVKWFETHAPKFIEVDGGMDETDIILSSSGNYVRCTVSAGASQADIEGVRQFLTDNGAKGVVILSQKKILEVEREEVSSIKAGASIETSISDYVGKLSAGDKTEELNKLCLSILEKARMEMAE